MSNQATEVGDRWRLSGREGDRVASTSLARAGVLRPPGPRLEVAGLRRALPNATLQLTVPVAKLAEGRSRASSTLAGQKRYS